MNEDLIVYIILQEFKHHQIIAGLKKMTFESGWFSISFLEVIPPLMGVPMQEDGSFPEISDQLSNVYYNYLEQAAHYRIHKDDKILEMIATECYDAILSIVR